MKAKNRDQSLSDSRELDGSYDQLTECLQPGLIHLAFTSILAALMLFSFPCFPSSNKTPSLTPLPLLSSSPPIQGAVGPQFNEAGSHNQS
ncbi:hypothetical protein PAMA_002468 [Pampus argenteus]